MNQLVKMIYGTMGLSVIAVLAVIMFGSSQPQQCGIENCHGLDIVCGSNLPDACTEIYQLGDKCRQFAMCGVVDGECTQLKNIKFDNCKACADKCAEDFKDDGDKAFQCESKCGR